MSKLRVGDPAPDFALTAEDGSTVRLSDYRGKPVVLMFYPMDQTAGCTKQLCAARDDYDRYQAAGIAVFGVNNGSIKSHRRFVDKYGLRTPLLVDEGFGVATAYDAAFGFGPLRAITRTVVGITPSAEVAYYKRGMPSTDEIIGALSTPA
jgi:peroxiredoxin Q/BCP